MALDARATAMFAVHSESGRLRSNRRLGMAAGATALASGIEAWQTSRFISSIVLEASYHYVRLLMETSSHKGASMPSIIHATCPPLHQGDQWTIKYRPSRAHPQISTLFPKSALLKAPAPAVAMAEGEAQWRALLHQSVESWTRRHRIEIR